MTLGTQSARMTIGDPAKESAVYRQTSWPDNRKALFTAGLCGLEIVTGSLYPWAETNERMLVLNLSVSVKKIVLS